MTNKLNYVVFNILTVLAYFYGVLLCATLILIPVGVYSIIAAHGYSAFADMSDVEAARIKKYRTAWIVFGCVLYFPLGLIGLLGLYATSNNIQVNDITDNIGQSAYTQPEQQTSDAVAQPTLVEVSQPVTDEERAEKLEKLARFKQQGLITQEEYDQAVGGINHSDK